jgi:hypothetical protein
MAREVRDAWWAQLQDGNIEIFLRVANVKGVTDRKIRAHGPEAEMFELVEWFEKQTGLHVRGTWRRRTPTQIEGQMGLLNDTEGSDT